MRKDFIDTYKKFIDYMGIESQFNMCIEEMSELTKELCKYKRYKSTENESLIIKNIKEELADVLNMIEQLEFYFGESEIEVLRADKIKRANKLYFDK